MFHSFRGINLKYGRCELRASALPITPMLMVLSLIDLLSVQSIKCATKELPGTLLSYFSPTAQYRIASGYPSTTLPFVAIRIFVMPDRESALGLREALLVRVVE